jgi:transcriptional regulator with GAF, ATPase, and Fis domain
VWPARAGVEAVDVSEKAAILTRLANLVGADDQDRPLTDRLCHACQHLLGVDGAAITVQSDETSWVTLSATNVLAARLEDLQDVLGEGPSRDAFLRGELTVTTVGDDSDRRWPEFQRAAQSDAAGVFYAVPMRPGAEVLGVLSLHRRDAAPLTEPLATAQFLADAVGAALLQDPLARGSHHGAGSWANRAEVHQATGMVIAQMNLGAEDALAILKAHAYADSTSLAVIAHRVVTRELDFGRQSP